ncbi:unnamed protein product [Phytophthora lilii]|uniref:RxLR effector protein n=1 Tax=Phytophthora lilii TaxID=2077276 RepID=A0A9W6U4C0_9STRA|nr:unnamed protein product [Phytophthora lilii]
MRVLSIIIVTVLTFLASTNTLAGNVVTQQTVSQISREDVLTMTRFLKGPATSANTEERGPNIDIAIADAAKKFNKKVIWQIQFALWKHILRRTPLQARGKLGLLGKGREVYQQKGYEKFAAYDDMYGKGPLTYP